MGSTLGEMRGSRKKGVAIGFGIGSNCVVLFESESIAVAECTTRKGVSQSIKDNISFGT